MRKYTVDTADNVIGSKIKSRRKALKLTQKQLADSIGVTFQQVQKYENGNNRICISAFLNFCNVLHVHPSYFFDIFSFHEDASDPDIDMENKLLATFRLVDSKHVRSRILKLVEAVVSDFEEE